MQNFQQLSLPVALDDQATFDNFYAPNGTPQHIATFVLKDEGRRLRILRSGKYHFSTYLIDAAIVGAVSSSLRTAVQIIWA